MSQFMYDASGQKFELAQLIGRGGEGAVYAVHGKPDLVAKIYEKPVENQKVEKLASMIKLAKPSIFEVAAWPKSTIHKSINSTVCGLLMPYLKDQRDIHELYSPAQRRTFFPYADWKFLTLVAANCASAFDTLHQAGCIVGDVNQSNIRVDKKALVKFIDCDSFQITHNGKRYECGVGVPFYTPPELQGKSLAGIERTENHDAFGLALLVFHLLFMGRHPFAGRFQQNTDMPIEKAIREYRFAFGPGAKAALMIEPPHSLAWQALPREIGSLFERSFNKNGQSKRPTPLEWRSSLVQLSKSLKECDQDPGHKYFQRLSDCPWCSIMNSGGPNFFISVVAAITTPVNSNFDIQSLWNEIANINWKHLALLQPSIPSGWKPKLRRLPESLTGAQSGLKYGKEPYSVLQRLVMFVIFFGIPLLPWGNPWTLLGFVMIAFFASWFAILEYFRQIEEAVLNREYHSVKAVLSKEHYERSYLYRAKETEFNQLNYLHSTREAELHAVFSNTKLEYEQYRSTYHSLDSMFNQELHTLGNASEKIQREAFLRSKFIDAHTIEGIGQTRTATLRSYGIETAWDIDPDYIRANVPGFGDSLTSNLALWRSYMETQFRFNPKVAVSQADRDALQVKFNRLRFDIQRKLKNGPATLKKLLAMYAEFCKEHNQRIQKSYLEMADAKANLDILPNG
ncbi:MAG TPA: hypothetical protein PLN21_07135 [Gemmatales bacterium]|nr:hypothetical protein [Gemmatales bacterium]